MPDVPLKLGVSARNPPGSSSECPTGTSQRSSHICEPVLNPEATDLSLHDGLIIMLNQGVRKRLENINLVCIGKVGDGHKSWGWTHM